MIVDARLVFSSTVRAALALAGPGAIPASAQLPSTISFSHVFGSDVDEFRVTRLNPQHPQDGRRDILVFDAYLTNCYRAFEYLETGALEAFWRECQAISLSIFCKLPILNCGLRQDRTARNRCQVSRCR